MCWNLLQILVIHTTTIQLESLNILEEVESLDEKVCVDW